MYDTECIVCKEKATDVGTFFYISQKKFSLCKDHSIELFLIGEVKFNNKYKITSIIKRNIYKGRD